MLDCSSADSTAVLSQKAPTTSIAANLRAASNEYAAAVRELDELHRDGSIDQRTCVTFKKSAKDAFEARKQEIAKGAIRPSSAANTTAAAGGGGEEATRSELDKFLDGGEGEREEETKTKPITPLQIETAVEANEVQGGGSTRLEFGEVDGAAEEGASNEKKPPSQPFYVKYLRVFGSSVLSSIVDGADGAMLTHLHVKEYRRIKKTLKQGLIFIGVLMQIVGLIVFIFFFQQSFLASYSTEKFVSLSPDSGVCTEVSRPYTIPFITADFDANWQGTFDFNSNKNFYVFNLFDLSLTDSEYQDLMRNFADAVASVGYTAERSELAVNLLYFNTWTHSITTVGSLGGKVTQTMSFAAHAINILGTDYISGTVMDMKGDCPEYATKKAYNAATGELIMTFDMEHWHDTGNYTYLQPCVHALDEIYLGYDSNVDGNTFEIRADGTAIFSALAYAFGIAPLSYFTYIDNIVPSAQFMGINYRVDRYYDSSNSIMHPMHCIKPVNFAADDNSQTSCVVSIGKAFGIPFFHQSGADQMQQQAIPCVCNIVAQNNDQCDSFDLLIGVMVFHGTGSAINLYPVTIRPYIPVMEVFYIPPPYNNTVVTQLMYYGAFAGTHQTANGMVNPFYQTVYTTPEWREAHYNWTYTPDFGHGSFIVWRLLSPRDRKISSDNTQLPNGACHDAFSSPSWYLFYSNPWGKLTETYFQCTKGFQDALVSAVGIAGSTASQLVSLLFGIFIWLVMTIFALIYATDDGIDKQVVPLNMEPAELSTTITLDENLEKISAQLEMVKAKLKDHDEALAFL